MYSGGLKSTGMKRNIRGCVYALPWHALSGMNELPSVFQSEHEADYQSQCLITYIRPVRAKEIYAI